MELKTEMTVAHDPDLIRVEADYWEIRTVSRHF